MDLIDECLLLRCFAANREFVPPTWLMRQAGHHLANQALQPSGPRAAIWSRMGTSASRSMMLAAGW